MTKTIYYFLIALLFFGCLSTEKTDDTLDRNKLTQILKYSKTLFDTKIIDSKSILDSLASFSDKIIPDTAHYSRIPKANLFISTNTNTYFQVFEKPKGIITAIAFFINDRKFNVAEYYQNGQVICKFSVNDNGKRHGRYECYYEDGSYRHFGHYKNDMEILDSLKRFDD